MIVLARLIESLCCIICNPDQISRVCIWHVVLYYIMDRVNLFDHFEFFLRQDTTGRTGDFGHINHFSYQLDKVSSIRCLVLLCRNKNVEIDINISNSAVIYLLYRFVHLQPQYYLK